MRHSKVLPVLPVIVSGCLLLLLSFGYRAGFGLFMQPMSAANDWGRDVLSLALGIQKTLVERGIVCHQVIVCDEIGEPGHYRFAGWRGTQHAIRDAGVVLDKPIDLYTGIHQGLKSPGNLARFHPYRANFYGAITHAWRQAAGLEIENYDRVSGSALGLLHRVSVKNDRVKRSTRAAGMT